MSTHLTCTDIMLFSKVLRVIRVIRPRSGCAVVSYSLICGTSVRSGQHVTSSAVGGVTPAGVATAAYLRRATCQSYSHHRSIRDAARTNTMKCETSSTSTACPTAQHKFTHLTKEQERTKATTTEVDTSDQMAEKNNSEETCHKREFTRATRFRERTAERPYRKACQQ